MFCPSDNTQAADPSHFWSYGVHWDAHRIGWVVAGISTIVSVIITVVTVLNHCRNYTKPAEQRQIIRILYMPPITAIISFFSYRFFRGFTYYFLVEVVYESITLSAWMLLLIEYVASTSVGHSAEGALSRKNKQHLPIPFCCWRYRPTKAYFMYTVKWSVMQYIVVQPALTIAGIICEHFNVLCDSKSFNIHFASFYLNMIQFFSLGDIWFGLVLQSDEGGTCRTPPFSKFLSIKLITGFIFYQTIIFAALENRVIHGTEFWTSTNIANGLTALATCIEMIFFAALMMWSFSWKEYRVQPRERHTSIWRPLWDSINLWDFVVEIGSELSYFASLITGRRPAPSTKRSFGQAFDIESYVQVDLDGELRSIAYRPLDETSYASRASLG
ncbi:DUF300-domain-containing protein [Russula aff. rugulosa BPL654]|nr:DUF300-domain-containing protein [Russula aff. rugulosa BPL654]